MAVEELSKELKSYYYKHSIMVEGEDTHRKNLWNIMDDYVSLHPHSNAIQLKTAQYEIIAENFQPVIFINSPFYSEMGVKAAEYDGVSTLSAGGWLSLRNAHLFRDINPDDYDKYIAAEKHGIHLTYGPYVEYDHHCFPYSNVLQNGLSCIYKQAETELTHCKNKEEAEFIECTLRGLLAVKKISEKFAKTSRKMLKTTRNTVHRRYLNMIAKTAEKVPWRQPETFYECLCAIWFLHEICASIEGIGMSVIGHLDKMSGEFYKRDIVAGHLTSEEAFDLICRFLIHTDSKLDLCKPVKESFNKQEQGDTLILGGCDENGIEICNDVTLMTLKAHRELKLIYPKIHCRISRNSNQAFLDAINTDFKRGRNVISFLNDDCLIPAQVKAGKRLEDARCYVAGGCWEVIIEGCEHSAGANCYLNLARLVDMSIHKQPDVEAETGYYCNNIDDVEDFEGIYQIIMDNIIRTIRRMCKIKGKNGRIWPQVNPAPFFSACLTDCLKNRKDYTAGGGRYNPHGMPLTNFAILVDSLLAVNHLCFKTNSHSLETLLAAVQSNWRDSEALRVEALRSPHFGDNSKESNGLACRILTDIYDKTRDLKNERGGPFQLGLYSYRDILDWASVTGATPDGRKAGDFLAQGLTPSRIHCSSSEITSAINSGASLDLSSYPANSVITLSLPLNGVTRQVLAQIERTFAASGIGMLQLNCVDKDTLHDACVHPELHQDLIVRLYGYSARFINLTPGMQREFLSRISYDC